MAHNSSTPSKRRLQKVESSPALDEKWKTSPSTEVTSDQAHNAEVARERKRSENAALAPEPAAPVKGRRGR